jgi:enediyne biosynthesis protein E4
MFRLHRTRCLHLICSALVVAVSWCVGCSGRSVNSPGVAPPAGIAGISQNAVPQIASSRGRFVDITQIAGIRYRWEIPGKRPLNLLQTIGNGCALFDYDGDNNLDALLVGPKLALYRGDGQGHFRDVTRETNLDKYSGQFLGCASGDYDNDGYPDLYISGYRTGLLLHNEPTKNERPTTNGSSSSGVRPSSLVVRRFRDVTTQAGLKPQPWGTSCAFGDVDRDGRLDLYVGNYVKFSPATIPQLCARGGHLTACGPLSYQPEFGVLYLNRGKGIFAESTRLWGADKVSGKALGVAFAPGIRDGGLALAIANDVMPGDLLTANGRRFTNVGLLSGMAYTAEGKPYGGMGIDWGDYNNDGSLDLAVATFEGEAKPIFRNEGNGFFEDQSQALGLTAKTLPYVAFGMKWLDFNNDGWLDLMISNGHVANNIADYDKVHTYRQPTLLFANHAGQQFEEISARSGPDLVRPLVGRGLATGDIDNDGKVDVLLVDSEGSPLLLHNQTASDSHWLRVKLIGTRCNRDGFGAVVTADTGSATLTRHCHTDGSYLSASDARLHFGLGAATRVTITVRWPDGHVDKFPDVSADQQITIREGASSLSSSTK